MNDKKKTLGDCDVAIIGMACRFPGAPDYRSFWRNLVNGASAITEVPPDRWPVDQYYSADRNSPGKSNSKWGGFLENIHAFDHHFFGISPREAKNMDPQQRLLLEEVWHCLEDSGIRPADLRRRRTGVCVGVMAIDHYQDVLDADTLTDAYACSGTYGCVLANRISYFLGLRGPSLAVDAACASSLVAIHEARRWLQARDCDYVLAAGVSLDFNPWKYVSFSKARMLSPDGQCKTFDKDANGYVPGEGVGLLLLQPLEQALADGNQIYAILKGSAINHNGHSVSLTAPRAEAQRDVLLRAYEEADINPETISYLEAHGTGTTLGDPIEVEALTHAFRRYTEAKQFCLIGSVKTNIGHLEAAAGIAGVIKVVLMMRHRVIPKTLNIATLNPIIDFANSPFRVADQRTAWDSPVGTPRRAGVSSFGFGGVNCHVVLEERPEDVKQGTPAASEYFPFILSGKTDASLARLLQSWMDYVEHEEFEQLDLADVCRTLMAGRDHFPSRFGICVRSKSEVKAGLRQAAGEEDLAKPAGGWVLKVGGVRRTDAALIVPAYERLSSFRAAFDRCEEELARVCGTNEPFQEIRKDKPIRAEHQAAFDFAVLFSLCRQSMDLAGPPELIVADLAGQHVALCLSGILSLNEALRALVEPRRKGPVVLERPRIPFYDAVHDRILQPLCMTSDYLNFLIAEITANVDLPRALTNQAVLLADSQHSFRKYLEEWNECLGQDGLDIFQLLSEVTLPPDIDLPSAQRWLLVFIVNSCLRKLNTTWNLSERFPVVDTHFIELSDLVTDAVLTPSEVLTLFLGERKEVVSIARTANLRLQRIDPHKSYFHLRTFCKRFEEIVEPKEWLEQLARTSLESKVTEGRLTLLVGGVSSGLAVPGQVDLQIGDPLERNIVESLVRLWRLGIEVDWAKYGGEAPFSRVSLPGYPFARESFSIRSGRKRHSSSEDQVSGSPADASRLQSRLMRDKGSSRFYREISLETDHLIRDHRIARRIIVPGALMVEMGLEAAHSSTVGPINSLSEIFIQHPCLVEGSCRIEVEVIGETDQFQLRAGDVTLCSGSFGNKPTVSPAPINIAELAVGDQFSSEAVYEIFGRLGYEYGSSLRVIRKAWKSSVVTVVKLESINSYEGKVSKCNPALLDGIMQSVLLAATSATLSPWSKIFVPFMIRQLHFWGDLSESCYAVIRAVELGAQGDHLRANAQAYDDAGQLLLELEQLHFKAVPLTFLQDQERTSRKQRSSDLKSVGSGKKVVEAPGSVPSGSTRESDVLNRAAGPSSKVSSRGEASVAFADTTRYKSQRGSATSAAVRKRSPENDSKVLAVGLSRIREELSLLLAQVLDVKLEDVDQDTDLRDYGLESVSITEFAEDLAERFGIDVNPPLIYEYPTIGGLAEHLAETYPQQLKAGFEEVESIGVGVVSSDLDDAEGSGATESRLVGSRLVASSTDVAIIGMAGRFPQSRNLHIFWQNLVNEKDLITEIPAERWPWQEYFGDPREENKTCSRWGGFLEDIDRFDASFFRISPREAELMDPQQRLWMEVVWEGIEDSGYRPSDLRGTKTGIFVGVCNDDYRSLIESKAANTEVLTATGTFFSIIPNRVSYFLDLRGPSVAVDTACSSSLVAIHQACRAIQDGDADLALAGGVNLCCSPKPYISFSQGGMLSPDGRCKTFDKDANGYVRGEGIGVVFLKGLQRAIDDHDHIYAVIKGSTVNHGGFTTSLTAPNPKAQTELLVSAYQAAGIPPWTVSYIETHGTGTELGDPIEVNGLKKAFARLAEKLNDGAAVSVGYCGIGSVKTNIGHLESAAGIAGVIKILLAMQHRTLPASINFRQMNPYIELEDSPFYVVRQTQKWEGIRNSQNEELPRRAGVSSFGIGGANAHVVLEEYRPFEERTPSIASSKEGEIIVLSAKTEDRLNGCAEDLLDFLENREGGRHVRLADMAYTLQIGRESFEHRLAIVARNKEELVAKLRAFLQGNQTDGLFVGRTPRGQISIGAKHDHVMQLLQSGANLERLAALWTDGGDIDWHGLQHDGPRQRISLPTYPFAGERYWVSKAGSQESKIALSSPKTGITHPLFDAQQVRQVSRQGVVQSSVEQLPIQTKSSPNGNSDGAPAGGAKQELFPEATRLRLFDATQNYLRGKMADVLKIPASSVGAEVEFSDFGLDSIMIINLNTGLERDLGSISKAVYFDHRTLRELTEYFVFNHADRLRAMLMMPEPSSKEADSTVTARGDASDGADSNLSAARTSSNDKMAPWMAPWMEPGRFKEIAIIGLSGRYPQANDLEAFWQNLKNGKDCISEVPLERWDHSKYYSPDKGKTDKCFAKWGGFLQDFDKFDPLFFNISPREAELMDPQERLFLEVVWSTLEDAGYTRARLRAGKGQVGVFVGVMWGEYQLYGTEELLKGNVIAPSSGYWSIANRVSYFLNFRGPSMAVDTACSSSLTAIHLACQSILSGDCQLAVAGGVNLSLHPSKYVFLCQRKFAASDGRCRSFGSGGDGYVPGEGVGAVLLKPLEVAISDGDHIYGVIKGSSVNHGGRTNGYTVPNSSSQVDLILQAFARAGVDPQSLSYLEAHGTGTSLGDPIEIDALTKAFRKFTQTKQFCPIGSVKSTIGHLESAAGIAGLTKVLLQMQHRTLVPSLHASDLNPNIDFENSPFYVQRDLSDWNWPQMMRNAGSSRVPRRAGISSFGAGGSNAYLIVEEFTAAKGLEEGKPPSSGGGEIIILSAKRETVLRAYAENLRRFLSGFMQEIKREPDEIRVCPSLSEIAYTLQVGREALETRVAFVVDSLEELLDKLTSYLEKSEETDGILRGIVKEHRLGTLQLGTDKEDIEYVDSLMRAQKLNKLGALWVAGVDIDWTRMPRAHTKTVSLPTYPFSRQRYWIPAGERSPLSGLGPRGLSQPAAVGLHPLIDCNESTLEEQSFKKVFSEAEFFLSDHVLGNQKILPGAASLEMARAAGDLSSGTAHVSKLKNVVWARPISSGDDLLEIHISLRPDEQLVRYEISTALDGRREMNSVGKIVYGSASDASRSPAAPILDLSEIKKRCPKLWWKAEVYTLFDSLGLRYGPAFQTVEELYTNRREAIARLALPKFLQPESSYYVLHPSLLDGAVQSVVGICCNDQDIEAKLYLPFSVEEVEIVGPLPETCYAHVVVRGDENGSEKRFDVAVLDESGRLLLALRNLAMRALPANAGKLLRGRTSPLYYRPVWQRVEPQVNSNSNQNHRPAGIVILDRTDEIFHLLKGQVQAESGKCPVVLIKPGPGYESFGDNVYQIDPTKGEEFKLLLEELRQQQIVPSNILNLWNKQTGSALDESNLDMERSRLESELNTGIYAVFHMTKALMQLKPAEQVRLVHLFESSSPATQSANEAVSGFARTLRQEDARLCYKTVHLTSKVTTHERSDIALQELRAVDQRWFTEVRYDQGERLVRSVLPMELAIGQEVSSGEFPLKRGGTYLISGGAGGLGMILAQYLATHYHSRLALIGRSEMSSEKQTDLERLRGLGAEAFYIRADISHFEQIQDAVYRIRRELGPLDGVIHSAGVIEDAFTVNKDIASFTRVLAPKIFGAVNLDWATRDEHLDFFVMFSSVVGLMGNVGQSDYAAANCFMDSFARCREELRGARRRSGKTLSINWPLWHKGGMKITPELERLLTKRTGMASLGTELGTQAFAECLSFEGTQIVVVDGNKEKIERYLEVSRALAPESQTSAAGNADPIDPAEQGSSRASVMARVQQDLLHITSRLLKVSRDDLDVETNIDEYGVDSLIMLEMINQIEKLYRVAIEPSILTQHPNIRRLSEFLVAHNLVKTDFVSSQPGHAQGQDHGNAKMVQTDLTSTSQNDPCYGGRFLHLNWKDAVVPSLASVGSIAVLASAGRFPGSPTLEIFWDNLSKGKHLVSEIPSDRWAIDDYYSPDRSAVRKSYSKWGGFMADIDCFDADFFGISDAEAVGMDPQQRILLELAQELFEQSGHSPGEIKNTHTAVFLGAGESNYIPNRVKELPPEGLEHLIVNQIPNMTAARISDFYSLRGPSETLDTACSASLVAIHRACQSLRSGESDMAVAGGIQLMIDPYYFVGFSKAGVLSPSGACKVFDRNADGIVLGEGAGLVLLKPLVHALRDGDQIEGVILGSAVNNDGHTMGLTTPNIEAQQEVIEAALKNAGVEADSLSYLEAHGTGTLLGDPIEIKAATQVFRRYTNELQFCAVGSLKSSMGHLLRAAGIASFVKVLSALRRRQIPPTLHCVEPHPRFRFAESPFYPVTSLQEWKVRNETRRAGISSFGFGGTNCHVIVEEFARQRHAHRVKRTPLPKTQFRRKRYWFNRAILDQARPSAAPLEDLALMDALKKLGSGHISLQQARQLIGT
jgi:acyl transferase domain-containing protein/NAD(P)-dependent dehydrogenase (short-subunit alcohol dehydrogenase family)